MIHPVDNGFQEALAIVSDAKASAERHCRAFGYSLLWEGGSDAGMLAQLGLPGDTGREVLIGDPSQARGFIRFLELVGRDEGLMRDGAQPWDAGGIYDVNVRSLGPLEVMNRAMQKAGHVAFGPLTAWDFGPLSVKEVVLHYWKPIVQGTSFVAVSMRRDGLPAVRVAGRELMRRHTADDGSTSTSPVTVVAAVTVSPSLTVILFMYWCR